MPSPRLADLPSSERPREKMQRLGPAALSPGELLALFLGSGTKGRNAIELGSDLVHKHGSLAALSRLELPQLLAEPGLGLAKSCQLLAAFELGRRATQEKMHREALDSPEKIAHFLQPHFLPLQQEVLCVLVLDTRLRLLHLAEISRGTLDETLAHPRDILRPVLLHQGHSFVLAHNHPSGDPNPSTADHQLTRRLADLAATMQTPLRDHLIIGQPREHGPAYFSFSQAGLLS